MVKGVSRRVIVVDSPDPRIFEQAIFILPTDGGGVSSRQLVDEAVRIARSYARGQTGVRRRWRPPSFFTRRYRMPCSKKRDALHGASLFL